MLFRSIPFIEWMDKRGITLNDISGDKQDLQGACLFPVTDSTDELGLLIRWMTSEPELIEGKELWLKLPRLTADQISAKANLKRLYKQREDYRRENWKALSANYEKSIFYQLDLEDAAKEMCSLKMELPDVLPETESHHLQMHNNIVMSQLLISVLLSSLCGVP